jgi:hypothetical protein
MDYVLVCAQNYIGPKAETRRRVRSSKRVGLYQQKTVLKPLSATTSGPSVRSEGFDERPLEGDLPFRRGAQFSESARNPNRSYCSLRGVSYEG